MQVSGFQSATSSPPEARQAQSVGSGAGGTASADRASSTQVRGQDGHAHDHDADVVSISPAAIAAANKSHETSSHTPDKQDEADDSNPTQPGEDAEASSADVDRKANGEALTKDEQKQVQELKDRDRETRTHEQAHKSAAGSYAQGGPVFEYQQGPDGQRYAVGGNVSIDSSAIPGDSQATIQKMQVIRRAALAPSNPSDQDRKVAAQASQAEQQARTELRQSNEDETTSAEDTDAHNRQGLFVDVSA